MTVTATALTSGESTTASTVVNFAAQPAGTQLVLVMVGDDYATATPSGWTQLWTLNTGGVFHGNTAWRKTASGSETSVTYTIGSASRSVHALIALSNVDTTTPVDVAGAAQFVNSSGGTYTTPTSGTSTSGARYGLAVIGGSNSGNLFTDLNTWVGSYVEVGQVASAATPGLILGVAGLQFAGGGTTSSGANYVGATPQSRTGGIVVFREASGGGVTDTARTGTLAWAGVRSAATAGIVAAAMAGSLTWAGVRAQSGTATTDTARTGSLVWAGTATKSVADQVGTARTGSLTWAGVAPVLSFTDISAGAGPGALLWAGAGATSTAGITSPARAATLAWSGTAAASTMLAAGADTLKVASLLWTGAPAKSASASTNIAPTGALAWSGIPARSAANATDAARSASLAWAALPAKSTTGTTTPARAATLAWSGTAASDSSARIDTTRAGSAIWAGVGAASTATGADDGRPVPDAALTLTAPRRELTLT